MRVALEDFDVEGAVHGLQQEALGLAGLYFLLKLRDVQMLLRHFREIFALDDRDELGILVVREVPARPEQAELADVRGEHLLVAAFAQEFEYEILQALAENRAFGLP